MNNFKKLYKEKCSNYTNYPSILPAANRIIVIGDIHGDFYMLLECLKKGKLINNNATLNDIKYGNYKWIGGDTVVVQVGDQIDSCRMTDCNNLEDNPDDINILYFMTALHKKASLKGGAVYSLVGNHEILNVMGDMSYVSHSNITMFNNYKTLNGKMIEEGLLGRKIAFSPGNDLANFLACTRKLVLIIGKNLFVHAGIIPLIAEKYRNIEDINKILSMFLLDELEQPEMFTDLFTNGKTSPLWTRVFGFKVNNCEELMGPLMQVYKVNNIYVGHTPQLKTGISSQCNNRIWMTDVGMSKAFNNISNSPHRNAQVLEIINDGEQFNVLK